MIKLFKKYTGFKITILFTLIVLLFAGATMTVQPKKSEAICCDSCCMCLGEIGTDISNWAQDWVKINLHFYIYLEIHRIRFFDFNFWQLKMLPLFIQIGTQLAAVGMEQVMAIGMFFDAKEQIERQRLLQELHTKANKDYFPSIGMCEFGTRIKSLAASERKGEMNSLILSERSLDRFLGNKDTGAAHGQKGDIAIRLDAFQSNYCDKYDNNNGLSLICPASTSSASIAARDRFNKDIDYQRTIADPWTISFDFTAGGTPSHSDEEILAMSNNLYGFNSFDRVDYKKVANTGRDVSDLQKAYMNMRSVVAKTKVAENSFNALMALKGEGTTGSREFIKAYLVELGIPDESEVTGSPEDVDDLIGDNPSYYAQMEVLTKKAYQSPIFYTNLYDKPANIERKGVALQAIGLIQKFDLLKSYLRTEASLSILLELSIDNLQREVEDNIQAISGQL